MPDYVENVHTRTTVAAFYRELVLSLQTQYGGEAFKPSLVFPVTSHVREAEAKFNDTHEITLEPADVVLVEGTINLTPKGWTGLPFQFGNTVARIQTIIVDAPSREVYPKTAVRPFSVLALRKE